MSSEPARRSGISARTSSKNALMRWTATMTKKSLMRISRRPHHPVVSQSIPRAHLHHRLLHRRQRRLRHPAYQRVARPRCGRSQRGAKGNPRNAGTSELARLWSDPLACALSARATYIGSAPPVSRAIRLTAPQTWTRLWRWWHARPHGCSHPAVCSTIAPPAKR